MVIFKKREENIMTKCEICGLYFHADDIQVCPECDMELCQECYERHVPKCTAEDYSFDDEDYEDESTILHICPNCGERLELDQSQNGSARVYCPDCDFVEELNAKQLAELNQEEAENNENYDNSENNILANEVDE